MAVAKTRARTTATRRAPRSFRTTAKRRQRGLIVVYTGDGKGKTTAALGLAMRALGHGRRVAVVQFMKGPWKTGEARFARELAARCDWYVLGGGFTWDTKNRKRDMADAQRAWDQCVSLLQDKRYHVVICDELNYVLQYGFLQVDDVMAGLRNKPVKTHVVITGRGAPQALIDMADVVTEMRKIKHPYDAGWLAQPVVDY